MRELASEGAETALTLLATDLVWPVLREATLGLEFDKSSGSRAEVAKEEVYSLLGIETRRFRGTYRAGHLFKGFLEAATRHLRRRATSRGTCVLPRP